jgi:adenosylcobinamide kinase/adenosylcobinamide-phosphate guanylyltransferase
MTAFDHQANPDDQINREKEIPLPLPLSSQIVLVLGGARSGKSTFAERLALRSGKSVAYVATATAGDEEMRERIQRHRAVRPAAWYTIEEPLDLLHAVRQASVRADVLLLDCITLWLSNWLFMQADTQGWEQDLPLYGSEMSASINGAVAEIEALLRVVAELDRHKTLLVVSNEVGMGIVPAHALGRLYRDALGRVNQRLASAATRVYLMVAGLGVDIKRLHDEAGL